MVSYPLLEHSTYAIALAAKMSEVGSQVGLDLFHVHYAIPHAVSAFLARSILGPARAPHRHHAARHRYHPGRATTARCSR